MEDYLAYLKGLGYNPPTEFPALGTQNMKSSGFRVGTYPGTVYDEDLYISEADIDSAAKIRSFYSDYIFDKLFAIREPTGSADFEYKQRAAWLFSAYYICSFADTPPHDSNKWHAALWDARTVYGKEYMDSAMYFAFKARQVPAPRSQKFDTFFFFTVDRGISVRENEQIPAKFHEIVKSHGIEPY